MNIKRNRKQEKRKREGEREEGRFDLFDTVKRQKNEFRYIWWVSAAKITDNTRAGRERQTEAAALVSPPAAPEEEEETPGAPPPLEDTPCTATSADTRKTNNKDALMKKKEKIIQGEGEMDVCVKVRGVCK